MNTFIITQYLTEIIPEAKATKAEITKYTSFQISIPFSVSFE